jgi:hypothetical protein
MADLDTSLPNLQPQLNPIINAPPAPQSHGGIGNFLGRLGDALLVANGRPAIYAQRQQNAALANYLGQIDPSMGDMVNNGVDAPTALALYKMQHPSPPDIIQEMQAVGIDPNSEQGKQIITSHLNGSSSGPSSVQEYEFAKQNGFGGSYMDFLNQKGGPLIANNGDGTFTIVPRNMVGGSAPAPSGEVTATNPKTGQKLRLNPQTNQWEPLGGATGSTPSPTFR